MTDPASSPVHTLPAYWYGTGPRNVFSEAVGLRSDSSAMGEELARRNKSVSSYPRFQLLLHREGEGNLWHCLMEIWSAWTTMDVLRMSSDPFNDNATFFRHPQDSIDTQVVILDDRSDGPYWDLWQLFANRKPVRLAELKPNKKMPHTETNIIVPLAGAGNPMWQNDWEPRDCTTSKQIVVTFIDRRAGWKLQDQERLLEVLKIRVPHIKVRSVGFASISFAEQLRIVRDADVLLGAHGAGLTHAMFMREGGHVVELQPSQMGAGKFNGFRNLDGMRNLGYTRAHVAPADEHSKQTRSPKTRRDDWHGTDVQIGEEEFLDITNVAIKSLFAKGACNFDIKE